MGQYEYQLLASDSDGDSASADVTIHVKPSPLYSKLNHKVHMELQLNIPQAFPNKVIQLLCVAHCCSFVSGPDLCAP